MSSLARCCCKFLRFRSLNVEGAQDPLNSGDEDAGEGLCQLRRLRNQCEALQDRTGILTGTPGATLEANSALAAIQDRLDDLDRVLRSARQGAASAAGTAFPAREVRISVPATPRSSTSSRRRSRRFRFPPSEAALCLAARGSESWRPRRIVYSDLAVTLERTGEEDDDTPQFQTYHWHNVDALEVHDPKSAQGSGSGGSSTLYEITLVLSDPTGERVRLQFATSQYVVLLSDCWEAARESGYTHPEGFDDSGSEGSFESIDMNEGEEDEEGAEQTGRAGGSFASISSGPPEGCAEFIEMFRESGGVITTKTQSVSKDVFEVSSQTPLKHLRATLLNSDAQSVISVFWKNKGVTNILAETPWEQLDSTPAVQVRCLHMWMPLKPMPMAPKASRVSVVYCLMGGETEEEPLVWSGVSRSLDVPYGMSFTVQSKHVFQHKNGSAGHIEMDNLVGCEWTGRCMVKGIVEGQVRSETVEVSKQLQALIQERCK